MCISINETVRHCFGEGKPVARVSPLQEGICFLEKVLAIRISTAPEYVIALAGNIGKVVDNLEKAREKAAARAISSTVHAVSEWDPIPTVSLLQDAIRDLPASACAGNDGLASLLARYLRYIRRLFLLRAKKAEEYYESCSSVSRMLGNTEKTFPYFVESYFLSERAPIDEIQAVAGTVLESYPEDPAANITRAFLLLLAGKASAAGTNLSNCLAYWRAKPKSEGLSSSSVLNIDDVIRSLALICVVIGNARGEYVDLPVTDTLYFVNEAMKRVSVIEEKVGPMTRGISHLVFIARLVGFSSVGQRKLSVDESKKRLRFQRSFPITISEGPEEIFEVNTEFNFSEDCSLLIWLCLIFLRRVQYYDLAIKVSETLISKVAVNSFAVCEKLFCEMLREIQTQCVQQFVDNEFNLCPLEVTFRDITVNSSITNSVICAFNELLRNSSDPLLSEIELIVRCRLGILMWISGGQLREEKSMCSAMFLSCAKMNPNFATAYTFLGHFYSLVSKDLIRAEKCYARALALYPLDVDAGYCLSKLYLDNNEEEKAVALWDLVDSSTSSHAFWSASLKAHYLLNKGQTEAAIDKFHRALEVDHQVSSWAGLGFSYVIGHQNVSAQRTLLKALEMQPLHPVLLTTVGEIERRLCLFSEAEGHFQAALNINPKDELVFICLIFSRACYIAPYLHITVSFFKGIEGYSRCVAGTRISKSIIWLDIWSSFFTIPWNRLHRKRFFSFIALVFACALDIINFKNFRS